MTQNLESRTRFVDVREVAKGSAQQLQADQKMFAEVRDRLQKDMTTPGSEGDFNTTERMWRNIKRYVGLLERLMAQKRSGTQPPADVAPVKRLSVVAKSARELFHEIAAIGRASTAVPIIRYFPIARQDIVLAHGTDRTGMNWGESWDHWGLEGTLMQRGLNIDGGFSGLPLDEAESCDLDEHGPCPYIMIQEFLSGDRGIEIYDGEQVSFDGPDFFIFHHPREKAKALKTVILPTR